MTSFYLFRSTHPEVFCKKNFLKNFAKFTENTYVGRQTSNFIKKNLKHSWFPVNFAKFLRRPILKSIEEQLLLPLTGQCPNLFAYYLLWTLHRKWTLLLKSFIFCAVENGKDGVILNYRSIWITSSKVGLTFYLRKISARKGLIRTQWNI